VFTGSTPKRLPPKKAVRMGDEGKAVGCVPPAALLSAPCRVEKASQCFKHSQFKKNESGGSCTRE